MTFDIAKQNPAKLAEVGHEFEVTTSYGDKTGILITVRGDQSPIVKNHGRKVFQEMKMKEQQAKRRGKEYELDLDDADLMSAEAAAVRIISWKGLLEDGKEVKFSKDEAVRICTEYSFVKEQVLEQSSNPYSFSKSAD